MSSNIIVIAGATAVGKSALALKLATQQNGVIINADSLQIYGALPILTAQPSADDYKTAPHVLYGTLAPDQICSAKIWLDLALPAIYTAWQNNQTPIVVGGTGLYLRALIEGLSPLPDVDEPSRQTARALHDQLGNPGFHTELQKIDPVMAARLNPNDTQRLIRAYEVRIATGKSLAEWQDIPATLPLPHATFHKILVDAPRDILRDRAFTRLHAMIAAGVLDEIADLYAQIESGALSPTCGPTQALGFWPLADVTRGKLSLNDGMGATFTQTAQYIKRQQTWFRHQMAFDETVMINSSGP